MAGIIEIPRFALPSQQLQKLPTAILPTPRTSDADFGGDIGRALSGAGDLLGDAVLEDAARRNEASARSIDTSFAGELRKLLHDPERGYYATKGRAAVDAYAPTYQAITALYDRHVAQAANPAQQQMARAVLDRRVRLASDGIAAHSVREDASWQSETRSARIDGAIADATLAWGDPAQLRLHYNTGLQEALASGAAGSDPVATDSERRSYATRFHAAVIGARVDADPEGARQYFEQNRAAIDPAAAAAFDARLALASERRRALGIADGAAPRDAGIVAFGPGPEPQRDDYVNRARTEAETLPEASPSLIRLTEAAAAKRHARDHAMWKQRRGDAINAAYEWADANPDASVAEMPMQVWSGLDPDTQTRVEGYVNAGGQVETDWQRYFELQDLAIDRPDDFVGIDLVEGKPDIADRDLDVLEVLQEILRKGDPDNERFRLRTTKEMVDDVVKAVGEDRNAPSALGLRRRFQEELTALERSTGRSVDPDEMQRVLARLSRSAMSEMKKKAQSSLVFGNVSSLYLAQTNDYPESQRSVRDGMSGALSMRAALNRSTPDSSANTNNFLPSLEPEAVDSGPDTVATFTGDIEYRRSTGIHKINEPPPRDGNIRGRSRDLPMLGTGGGGGGPVPRATGEVHHGISQRVHNALEDHQKLKGLYKYRDPRFETRAKDRDSHRGYDRFHRELDAEIERWIRGHPDATAQEFEGYLRSLYLRPDVLERFPNGLHNPSR